MSQTDDRAIQATLDELESIVAKMRNIPDLVTRRREEKDARAKLNLVKSQAQSFASAMQAKLTDAASRQQLNARSKQLDDRLKAIDAELRNLISAQSCAASAAATSSKKKTTHEEDEIKKIMGKGGVDGEGFTTAKEVLEATNRGQDSINQSLKRSLQIGKTIQTQTNDMATALGVGKR